MELASTCDEGVLKEEYLSLAFNVLASAYGVPPEKFDFEYTDKKGEYHVDRNISPFEFYKKYIGVNLDDYVEIASYQDDKFKYNNVYMEEESSRLSGYDDNICMDLSFKEFQSLIIKQLKGGEPVYFYCSTTSKRVDGAWCDIMERYGDIFGIDLGLDGNSVLKTNGVTGCHCMLMTGANVVDGKVNRWKIENSWGGKNGKNGYYVATGDWVDRYVHRVVINKKYLTKKQIAILDKEPIKVEKWDAKF